MAGTTVGEAFVKIRPDTTGFEQETKKSMGGVLAGLATGFAAAKVVDFFKSSAMAASDFNESASKAEAIFGKNSDAIRKWASGAVNDFGQTSQQALESAASFGNMFQQMDIGSGQATHMSKKMVELASDFASFHNADITEVLQAQQAAFRGEYDAVQRFVPTINAAAVEQKALAMTGKESNKELTAGEKAAATYALMLQGAGKALGDFDRTQGGAANQMRQFQAGMFELKATIGAALLPALTGVLKVLRPMVGWLAEHKTVAAGLAIVVGGVLVAAFVAWTAAMVKSTLATLQLSGGITGLAANIGRLMVTMAPWLAAVAVAVGLYVGLKHAITGAGMSNNVYASSLMGATKAQLAQAAALVLATQGYDGLKDKVREVAATSLTTARKMVEAADLPAKKRKELLAVIDAEERSQRRAQRASEDDARAKGNQAGKIDKVKTSLEDLNNYIRAQVDDTLRLESAQISMERSIQDLGAALRNTTLDTLEGRQAFNDTKSSIVNWGNQVAASAGLAGKTTEEATQDQINSLGFLAGTLAPGSPLRTWLEGYINQLRIGIPNDVNTNVNVNSDDAEARLKRLLGDIQALLMTSLLGVNVFVGPDGNILRVEGKGAEGAIVNRPTLALIGEAGPEAVVPLHKVAGNQALPKNLGAGGGGGDTFNIYTIATEPVPFALEVSRRMRREMFLAGR